MFYNDIMMIDLFLIPNKYYLTKDFECFVLENLEKKYQISTFLSKCSTLNCSSKLDQFIKQWFKINKKKMFLFLYNLSKTLTKTIPVPPFEIDFFLNTHFPSLYVETGGPNHPQRFGTCRNQEKESNCKTQTSGCFCMYGIQWQRHRRHRCWGEKGFSILYSTVQVMRTEEEIRNLPLCNHSNLIFTEEL